MPGRHGVNGLTPDRNMYPGEELAYVVRLSNRPASGGTATVPSGKRNLIGLSLNGVTQQLASLAGTATLAVGPGSDALSAGAVSTDSQEPACVSDALLADVQEYAGETWRTSPGHVERWSRVPAAFGVGNAYSKKATGEFVAKLAITAIMNKRTAAENRPRHGASTKNTLSRRVTGAHTAIIEIADLAPEIARPPGSVEGRTPMRGRMWMTGNSTERRWP